MLGNITAGGEVIGNLAGGGRRYFLKDHVGSVRTTVDRNGNIVGRNDYYPFGLAMPGRSSNSSNPNDDYKFTGHEQDNEAGLNLMYAGARYSDPILGGRWLSIDPKAHLLPSWSPYAYSLNNPVNFYDPDGAFPYTFHIRSFHPDATFGGGFMGDNRGFSNNVNSSARIAQKFTFDPSTGQSSGRGFANNFSMHPAGFVGSTTGQIPLPSSMFIGRETPSETHFDVSGGNGSFDISTGFAGANPLIPLISPDIDVHSNFSITENLEKGILSISANITGDNFPNAEAFVIDQSGKNSVFIGISSLSEKGLISLLGNGYKEMINANFNINLDNDGNFTGVSVGDQSFTIDQWNTQFQPNE